MYIKNLIINLYTFAFFLLIPNFEIYTVSQVSSSDSYVLCDNYDKANEDFWQKSAGENDAHSCWYWILNVTVLTSAILSGVTFFFFTEWFLFIAAIFGISYVFHLIVQLLSPTASYLLNFVDRSEFERSYKSCYPKIESVFKYEDDEPKQQEKKLENTSMTESKLKIKKIDIVNITEKLGIKFKINYSYSERENDGKLLTIMRINKKINRGVFAPQIDNCLSRLSDDRLANAHCCCTNRNNKHKIIREVRWDVEKIKTYMLIANNKLDKPWHVGFGWFFIFTVIPFSQLYKLLVNRYCGEQEMTLEYEIDNLKS